MDLLDRLLGHDHWATTQLVNVARGLTDAQLDQQCDVGHKTLRDTFEHTISNIEGWTAWMIQHPPDNPGDDRSLAALADRYERITATFGALARRIRDEQRFDDTFRDMSGEPMTFGAGILHVILHNEGHRVEILHILQRLGISDLPEIDHGLWDFVRRGLFQP